MSIQQEKHWQILPAIGDDLVKRYPDLSRIVLQLLFNRGITEKSEIEEFLNPPTPFIKGAYKESPQPPVTKGGSNDYDPFLFNDMERAVDLVIKHIKEQNKIVVYGDYDADGVTATAVLMDVLGTLRAEVEPYIPDRVSEGYGLNREAVKELSAAGVKLIIMVDGGIRSKEEVEYAKGFGLDVIVTDHHVPPVFNEDSNGNRIPKRVSDSLDGLPDCLIINPLVENEKYPFKYLAGVGVAFKLAKAIISKSKLSQDDKRKLEERVLDLVAVGTVADCVTLLGENRILVKRGLEVLNKTGRIGLRELIKAAQINNGKKLDSWNIGFQIAPRLNAAGRMDHANTALELLLTKNKKEAEAIARRLDDRNIERQRTTEDIVEQIESGLAPPPLHPPLPRGGVMDDKIIIAVTPDEEVWNEGVIGLAAGKISERYYLPALVITKNEEGYKGSGRSIEEFNIVEALEECSELLDKYGGHPAACGFSLKEENLEKFKEKIAKIAERKLKGVNLTPKIKIEAEIGLDEISEELIAEVEKFAPFGQNNERPKFLSRGVKIVDIITMGIDGKHIKLRVKSEESRIISAIGFSQAEQWRDLRIGDKIDIVYYIEMNEFNGRSEAQLKIVDIKMCDK
jgi:single-stranded-DNA-specific exonuclease